MEEREEREERGGGGPQGFHSIAHSPQVPYQVRFKGHIKGVQRSSNGSRASL